MEDGLEPTPAAIHDVAAAHWAITRTSDGSRWWMHSAIHKHVNRLVCGEALAGPHAGFNRLIEREAPVGGFNRAVSIGCGSGGKEAKLLRAGTVKHFELFEIGEFRRAQIQAKADEHGVGDRITIHIGDAFNHQPEATFDLVYWNNSLHHMLDTVEAINWSHRALQDSGCFAMDDFVGPSRFQWPDIDLDLGRRIRGILPQRFFKHPRNPSEQLDRGVSRPEISEMLETDPTEAADSDRIVKAVYSRFPNAKVISTGGVVYHLILNDVLSNFKDDDLDLLESLLVLDETLAQHGRTQYAVAIAHRQ